MQFQTSTEYYSVVLNSRMSELLKSDWASSILHVIVGKQSLVPQLLDSKLSNASMVLKAVVLKFHHT